LFHNYCFPSEERAALVECLAGLAPEGLDKVFLLTTGSEATECAIKLSRAHGLQVGGPKKIGIVGFERGFHGRTLGAQQAGGLAGQKAWIANLDPAIINAPSPMATGNRPPGSTRFSPRWITRECARNRWPG
jgi:adenosylmethionine-8-amino-7-oxononanoate aminotransferase